MDANEKMQDLIEEQLGQKYRAVVAELNELRRLAEALGLADLVNASNEAEVVLNPERAKAAERCRRELIAAGYQKTPYGYIKPAGADETK